MAQFPVGSMVWAKLAMKNHPWPGVIVNEEDAGLKAVKGKTCIFWISDNRVSMVPLKHIEVFNDGFEKYHSAAGNKLKEAIAESIQIQLKRTYNQDVTGLSFQERCGRMMTVPPNVQEVLTIPDCIVCTIKKIKDPSKNTKADEEEFEDDSIKRTDFYNKIRNGNMELKNVCLICYTESIRQLEIHPYFKGGLCLNCFAKFKSKLFLFDEETERKVYCLLCGKEKAVICFNENWMWAFCGICVGMGTDALRKRVIIGLKMNTKRGKEYVFNMFRSESHGIKKYHVPYTEALKIVYLTNEKKTSLQGRDRNIFNIKRINYQNFNEVKNNIGSCQYNLIIATFGDDVWHEKKIRNQHLCLTDECAEFVFEFYKLTSNYSKMWFIEMPAAIGEEIRFIINSFLNTSSRVIIFPEFGNQSSHLQNYRLIWSNIDFTHEELIHFYSNLIAN